MRRLQIVALERLDGAAMVQRSADQAVAQCRRVARRVPAYAAILRSRGIDAERIRSHADFLAHCPVLSKADLFGTFPVPDLCIGGRLGPLTGVLTSSGQGGRFAFGLTTPREAKAATRAITLAMEYLFGTDRYRTLVINALPMGVRFSCPTVTMAETSVREDMVCALVEQIAPSYEQIVLVTDPLFCKRLLDQGRASGIAWDRFKIHVVLGEETFGEAFRRYIATRLGQDPEGWTRGFVGSSMGIGEVGLNLFFETRDTVRLRQCADREPERMAAALGGWPGGAPPLLFVYDPLRIFVEVLDPDASGWGALTLSTLDPASPLPLIRYRTGDRARLLSTDEVARAVQAADAPAPVRAPRLPMVAIAGRERETLADGRTLLEIKDALYRDPTVADALSGAFRIEPAEPADAGYRISVQLTADSQRDPQVIAQSLEGLIPPSPQGRADQIEVFRHADFPFGRTLDYERKFDYLGEGSTRGPPTRP
jgi:phenylacetate-CoA ligase